MGVAPSRYDLTCAIIIRPVVASAAIFCLSCAGYFMELFFLATADFNVGGDVDLIFYSAGKQR